MAEEINNAQQGEGCAPSACASCASAGNCPSKKSPADLIEPQNKLSHIKHVIGVVSGKGGVGKSFVTGSLAVQLKKMGYSVGILDADITGPSIPKMFGLKQQLYGDEQGIFPAETALGIRVVSINMMLENEDDAVLWRGPILGGLIKQFYTEVHWGELDYLLIDMPPGTSDVAISVIQQIPVDQFVMVTTPSKLVSMVVGKAINMALQVNKPIVGLVENMAYVKCDNCSHEISIYKNDETAKTAEKYGLEAENRSKYYRGLLMLN